MVKSFEAFRQNVRELLRKCKQVSEVSQSCPTLGDPMDYSLQGSSVHGISQARVLEWAAVAFSRDLPHPGVKSASLALAGRRFITTDHLGSP